MTNKSNFVELFAPGIYLSGKIAGGLRHCGCGWPVKVTSPGKRSPARPIAQEQPMVTGTVKWFDVKKGFGFLVNAEGKDVFVHFSSIEGDGFRALKDGELVEYEEVD